MRSLYETVLMVNNYPLTGDAMSVMSEEGTVYGDDASSIGGDWSPESGDPTRDLLSRPPDPPHQATPRPPPHAEVQLRYLLQVCWCHFSLSLSFEFLAHKQSDTEPGLIYAIVIGNVFAQLVTRLKIFKLHVIFHFINIQDNFFIPIKYVLRFL